MRTFTSYTSDQVRDALAHLTLNGGNLKRTARSLGLPPSSLRRWRNKAVGSGEMSPDVVPAAPEKKDYAALWAEAQETAHHYLMEKAPEAAFRDLVVWAGVAADKHLDYSQGRKGGGLIQSEKTVVVFDL